MRFRLKNQLTYPMDADLLDSIANAELMWAAKFYGWEEPPHGNHVQPHIRRE